MSGNTELAKVLFGLRVSDNAGDNAPAIFTACEEAADSILSSDWLAAHDTEVTASLLAAVLELAAREQGKWDARYADEQPGFDAVGNFIAAINQLGTTETSER